MRKLLIVISLMLFISIVPVYTFAEDQPAVEAPAAEATAPATEALAAPAETAPAETGTTETGTTEAVPAGSSAASWIEANFHVIISGVLSLLAALGLIAVGRKWIIDKVFRGKERLFELVEQSVLEVYNEYVQAIKKKRKAKGGLGLTSDEAAKAREMATEKIKAKAKEHGLKIVSELVIPVLIEKAINGIRKGK